MYSTWSARSNQCGSPEAGVCLYANCPNSSYTVISKALGYAEGRDLQGKKQIILKHTSIVNICDIGVEG